MTLRRAFPKGGISADVTNRDRLRRVLGRRMRRTGRVDYVKSAPDVEGTLSYSVCDQ